MVYCYGILYDIKDMIFEGYYNFLKMYIIKYWICFIYKFDKVGYSYF